jgi:hypothetical protein
MELAGAHGQVYADAPDQRGRVIAFPDRWHGAERWEPFVAEATVARHFSVTTRTVRRWRLAGMPSYAIGGCRRFRLSECEAWHLREASA